MGSRATMADIAKLAGVSVPTVSKVVNGHSDISSKTRAKVQEAVRTAGYVGRSSRRSRTGVIDLVIDGIDSLWALEVIRGTEEAASQLGSSVVVTSTRHGSLAPRDWLARISARATDGVVVALTKTSADTVQRLTSLGVPLVLLDPLGGADPGIPTVGASNWLGGLTATEHFIELGHRRIAIIAGPEAVVCSQERLDGYLAALGRAGIPVSPELIVRGDFEVHGGRRAAAQLFELDERPTAIFASSDLQAAGLYQEAALRSVRIPEDLSVIGFDDIPLCDFLSPPLSTIRQPIVEMAREAVRLVNDRGENPSRNAGPSIQLSTSLVLRSSAVPYSPGS